MIMPVVCLATDKSVFFVWAEAPGTRGEFGEVSAADFRKALTVTHLSQTYL